MKHVKEGTKRVTHYFRSGGSSDTEYFCSGCNKFINEDKFNCGECSIGKKKKLDKIEHAK